MFSVTFATLMGNINHINLEMGGDLERVWALSLFALSHNFEISMMVIVYCQNDTVGMM